uniref:F-box domain-containing protein n=1 Tax=Ananas comosus var. bracteatus TaxID=296719 RepID=A0A6V7QVV2_ANACO
MKKAISGGRTLPEEVIAYGILPRLPAKTLIRLQCVSKRWRALISTDPHFMRLQDAHARSSPALLVFGETPCPVFLSRREERDQPRSIGFPRIFRQPLFGSPHGDWLPSQPAAESSALLQPRAAVGHPGSTWVIRCGWTGGLSLRPRLDPPVLCYEDAVSRPRHTGRYSLQARPAVFNAERYRWPSRSCFPRLLLHQGLVGISQQKVLVKVPGSRREIVGVGLRRSVCVEGVFFWLAGLEVLWFDPRDERGGAIPLPFTDEAQLLQNIGEWEGKLSFATLVDWEIRMWSWNRSSWSSRTLLTMETAAKADPDFFASMGLRMNLRSRSAESLETVLNRTCPSIAAFGAGFILLMFKPRVDVCFRGLCYDAATGKAWKLKRHGFCSLPTPIQTSPTIWLHAQVVSTLEFDIIYANYLINLYVKCGHLDIAHHVFDVLLKRNVVSGNALMVGYFYSGYPFKALELFKSIDFVELANGLNEYMFTTTLSACGNTGAHEEGRQCRAYVLKSGLVLFAHVRNTLLHMYSKCSGMEDALGVFKALLMSIVNGVECFCGSAIIDMYGKCGDAQNAQIVLEMLQNKNVVSWTTVMAACAQNKCFEDTLKLF